jgi:uncharacterized protein
LKKELNISISPKAAADEILLKTEVSRILSVPETEITTVRIIRRSVDARSRNIKLNLGVEVFIGEEPESNRDFQFDYKNVESAQPVIIVGAGPAGLFAALKFIELGLKPLIFERGKDVSARKRDIAAIHRNEQLNPDSNYGFGEGGAGTFSDGKLYTRSKKRGDVTKILQVFYSHGAQEDILIDAHPHIGTNLLPRIIKSIREFIIQAGGEVHFDSKVVDFIVENDSLTGIKLANGNTHKAKAVVLATGHSARDIYYLLREKGIHLEAKNFAVGIRVEHPQALIDSIQYHRNNRGIYLPPATYSLVEQINDRGVYSFCMCPGGTVVPAATSDNQMVVNGMSPTLRGGEFANSGIVVEVQTDDLKQYGKFREFAGLKFQEEMERKAFEMADRTMFAPAQRLSDFVEGRKSGSLPATSYHPGLKESELNKWLPSFIGSRLQQGFLQMGRKARGFITDQAVVIGVETRTSSPIRIPRDPDSFEHVKIRRLFPCGEGAGYAGGIVSSAIDGERCAEKVAIALGVLPDVEIPKGL